MTSRPTYLDSSSVFQLKKPDNVVVKVFKSLSPFLSGHPRLDDAAESIDPWTTSMKWMDHMSHRGWDPIEVSHFVLKSNIYVIVTMEKPRV